MKKVIKKYWGIGLVIMLLSSLFVAGAPASAADPLTWNAHIDTPSAMPGVASLAPGSDILDFDYSADGMTAYAVTGTSLYQSTFGGSYCTDIATRVTTITNPLPANSLQYVAMAPDDPNVVAVAGSANGTLPAEVAISVNGGATFTSMNFQGVEASVALTQLSGLTISPMATGGIRYISVFGRNAANDSPILYYYNYGSGVGSWVDAVANAAWAGWAAGASPNSQDDIAAMVFSPNFPSDYMAVALSADSANGTAGAGTLRLHVLSFNSLMWDALVGTGYPRNVTTAAAAATTFTINSASLALLPDYDGSDESLRLAFVGAAITTNGIATGEGGGIWRHLDSNPGVQIYGSATAGVAINSVAFDGTNLAAGSYDTNNVFRSTDPLANSPTVLSARSMKRIGIDDLAGADINDQVIVKFVGETLYGAKIGDASALSKSTDYGNTWNDFSLMASLLTTVTDIMPAADGSSWYLAANDGVTTSVYKMAPFLLERTLCVPNADAGGFILRGIASDPNVIYAADSVAPMTALYYTDNGGNSRWYKRTAPAAIADMAVESQAVVYIGQGINVYKSINAGFTWSLPVNSQITGAVNTILSVGENELIVGGNTGAVTFSTDGGATWTKTLGVGYGMVGATQLAATGLGPSDYIFGTDGVSNQVYRSPAAYFGEFKSMNLATTGAVGAAAAYVTTGLKMQDGVLYAVSANGTHSLLNRTSAPGIPTDTHPAVLWSTEFGPTAIAADRAPSALRSHSAGGTVTLNVIDTASVFSFIYYFDDTIALSGPALIAPAEGKRVEVISSLLGNVQDVAFSWNRISLATNYNLFIALDPDFNELVTPTVGGAPANQPWVPVGSTFDPVSQIVDGATFVPGTTYYWRVAVSAPMTSAFSETRTFIIAPTAATVPTVSSPEVGGSTQSTTPAFSWSPVSGATLYQFQLSDDPAFGATIMDEQLATAGIVASSALEKGKTYFWRVKALEPVEGDWSTVANFMVAVDAPAAAPPVVVEQVPAPVINIPEAPPATVVEIPPAPTPEQIAPAYIWAIIIIGAVLVIAVIVLIVRTRRQV